jgi:hypothetical protein
MKVKEKRCDFLIERGYWKGAQCGNNAILKFKGGDYCAVHYGKMVKKHKAGKQGVN